MKKSISILGFSFAAVTAVLLSTASAWALQCSDASKPGFDFMRCSALATQGNTSSILTPIAVKNANSAAAQPAAAAPATAPAAAPAGDSSDQLTPVQVTAQKIPYQDSSGALPDGTSWSTFTTNGITNTTCSGPSCGPNGTLPASVLNSAGNSGAAPAGAPAGAQAAAGQTPATLGDMTSTDSSGGGTSGGNCPLMSMGNDQVTAMNNDFNNDLKAKPPSGMTADQQKATSACVSAMKQHKETVLRAITSQDTANGTKLCNLQGKVQNGNYGVADGMMFASNAANNAKVGYTKAYGVFKDQFKPPASSSLDISGFACGSAGFSEKQTDQETSADQNDASGAKKDSTYGFCDDQKYCGNSNVVGNLHQTCVNLGQKFEQLLTIKVGQASCYANAYSTSSTTMKIGAAAVAVGAVALAVAAYDRHQDANHRQMMANNYNNAVIQVNGQTVDCKTPSTYTAAACQAPLMNYCTQTANLNAAGCGAFNQYYCAQAGSSVSYCLSGSARSYCGNAVSSVPGLNSGSTFNTAGTTNAVGIANSPACQWLSNMPQNCTTNPSQLGCLSTMTPTQLAATCPSYTSDPLCQAYNSGQVVYQPTGGVTTVTNTGTSTTLPVATGTTTTASTGTTTTGSGSMGGFIAVNHESTRNMFADESGSLSKLCHNGSTQLMGCH